MSKIKVTVGEKLFSSFFNENGWNSKYEFGQWKYLKKWAFYAFRPFFKFQQFPRYAPFNKYNGIQPAIKARSKTKLGHRKNRGRGLICARASRAYINLFVNSERSEHLKWFCKCWAKRNMQNWPLKVTSFAKWAKRIACKNFCQMSGANFLQNILQLSEAKYAG